MEKKRELKWGETPWDNLTREELLREVRRLYSAGLSMASCLKMAREAQPESLYWQKRGAGGRALAKWDLINEPLEREHGSESIWRAFFRSADDLLFTPELGSNWIVCPVCGEMRGPRQPPSVRIEKCMSCDADREFRPLDWLDLKPAPQTQV